MEQTGNHASWHCAWRQEPFCGTPADLVQTQRGHPALARPLPLTAVHITQRQEDPGGDRGKETRARRLASLYGVTILLYQH